MRLFLFASAIARFSAFFLLTVFLILWNLFLAAKMIFNLHMNDFGKFYYSTLAYLDGHSMYGMSPATLIPITDSLHKHFWNLNPPHFHILMLPFTYFSLETAYALWMAFNFFLFIVSAVLIKNSLGISPERRTLILMFFLFLSFSGTGMVILTGQPSFVLLFLLTIAWGKARSGSWAAAGLILGVLAAIKPFFLIFFPYLLLRRRSLPLLAAGAVFGLSFALGILAMGTEPYVDWYRSISLVDWSWASMNGSLLGFLTRIFSSSPNFAPVFDAPFMVKPLWIFLSVCIGVGSFFAIHADHRPNTVDRDFALLIICALLVSPLGWIYYLWLALGPLTAIVCSWTEAEAALQPGRLLRLKRLVFALAWFGFCWPYPATLYFNTGLLSGATIGSTYFWSYVLLWMLLVVHFPAIRLDEFPRIAGRHTGVSASHG
jgi:hypothetical protein